MKTMKIRMFPGLFLLFLVLGIFIMQYLQSVLQGSTITLGIDLYPRWVGSKIALNGNSPYTLETRQQIWLAIYGSTDLPSGNPFGFYYPPAIVTILAPFIFMDISIQNAAVLWCAFLWALLSMFIVHWILSLPNLSKARLIIPLLLIGGWFFRPAFSNYILGQFALFSVLMTITAWYSFEKEKPILAGIFCTFSLLKPSLTILPVILLLVLYRRQLTGLISFMISSLVLYLPPTLILGWWPPDFFADISNYALENRVSWSIVDINTPAGLTWLFASSVLGMFGLFTKDTRISMTSALALNAIFVPHTADYDLVVLILPLVYLSSIWLFAKNKKLLFSTLFFILLWFPWVSLLFFLQTKTGNAVETWYRFIWLTYPNLILISVLLTQFTSIRIALSRLWSDSKNKVHHKENSAISEI